MISEKIKNPGFNLKLFLIVIILMITTHLIIFAYYTANNKRYEAKVNRNLINRQVINLIETVRNTPAEDRKNVVKDIFIPNVKVTIDSHPLWNEQLKNATLWHILQMISKKSKTSKVIQFSLWLDNNNWLNLSATTGQTSWTLQLLLIFLELATVTTIIFSLWSFNRFSQPLQNFMTAADRLGVDLNAQPLSEYGPEIVRDTAQAINKMQQRIVDLISERTQMIAAISHDLRTPITRLKLRADYIEDADLFENVMSDLDEMEAMVSETLTFSSDDSKRHQKTNLDLNSLLQSLCSDLEDTGYEVHYQGTAHRVRFFGRPISLKRAFMNLITNAVKYGKRASVTLTQTENSIIVSVEDEGPGLDEQQLKEVFRPFYRAESSRSRKTGGTGLGLAVTKDIISRHDGEVELMLRQDKKGLRAEVRFVICHSGEAPK